MKRYYFHIRYADELVPDLEGSVMRDDSAAIEEAVAAAREIIADTLKRGRPIHTGAALEIVDENAILIDTVLFPTLIQFK